MTPGHRTGPGAAGSGPHRRLPVPGEARATMDLCLAVPAQRRHGTDSPAQRLAAQLPALTPSISIVTVMFQRRPSGTAPDGATTTRNTMSPWLEAP